MDVPRPFANHAPLEPAPDLVARTEAGMRELSQHVSALAAAQQGQEPVNPEMLRGLQAMSAMGREAQSKLDELLTETALNGGVAKSPFRIA